MTLSKELTEIDADCLPDIAARGRDVLMQRAATLGPETGKDGDDLALASTYEGAYSPRTLLTRSRLKPWRCLSVTCPQRV